MIPSLNRVDHIHIYVPDRAAAETWYREVLGFRRNSRLESWAVPHGPLMLENETGEIMFALFERPAEPNRAVIAMSVTATGFRHWCEHLTTALGKEIKPIDHGISWSIYFTDLDGNPFEITTYDYDQAKP